VVVQLLLFINVYLFRNSETSCYQIEVKKMRTICARTNNSFLKLHANA
jgi:hypothetical protein